MAGAERPADAARAGSCAAGMGYGTQRLAPRRSYSTTTTRPPGRNPLVSRGSKRGEAEMSDRRGAEARRVRPRLQVPVVSAAAGFRRPALAVSVELEGLAAFATVWCTAVPHLPGASQSQLRLVRLVAVGVA